MWKHLYFVVGLTSLLGVSAKNFQITYEDEIDPVIDMLLNTDYDIVLDTDDKEIDDVNEVDDLTFSDGIWKCGNCTHISEPNLIYTEKYDLNSNYDMYTEEGNLEIQIGLSLQEMRCVVLKTDEDSEVRRVNGVCVGGPVTLSVVNAFNCDVSVYS